eukprot:scaffold4705_cov156-Skeletonema_menzelii.AAC.6
MTQQGVINCILLALRLDENTTPQGTPCMKAPLVTDETAGDPLDGQSVRSWVCPPVETGNYTKYRQLPDTGHTCRMEDWLSPEFQSSFQIGPAGRAKSMLHSSDGMQLQLEP